MDFKKWLLEMHNTTYEYSSVHIDVPSPLDNQIIQWGKKRIKESDVFVSKEDPSFGRENEIHITILYGIHSSEPKVVEEYFKNHGSIKVKLGKINVFPQPNKFDVVVIDVVSDQLNKLNKTLKEKVEYTNNYKQYRPHVTIAYVDKDKGQQYKGDNRWEGVEFKCDYVVFSSKKGIKDRIKL
jgi:2'-5' RNA ligase